MSSRTHRAVALAGPLRLLPILLAACAADAPPPASLPPTASTAAPAAASEPVFATRPTMAEASRRFAEAGCQPGEPLPPLSLVDLEGRPVDLPAHTAGRPLVLVTCSLTCNVARRQQAAVAALQRELGERVCVVMIYTLDAHPAVDDCPYTGDLWVPPANSTDDVLVRQPRTLTDRLALARRYARDWAAGVTVFVDTMDDASWRALGRAPNLGLGVDRGGIVRTRTGWFDAAALRAAVDATPARGS